MAGRAASRHAGQSLEDLLRCLVLHDRLGQGIHILVDGHAQLLERQILLTI